MKALTVTIIIQLTVGVALLIPAPGYSDQTDARLNTLFTTLKTSKNAVVLQETEADIWAIWFDSGREEIDNLMEKAGIAVQSSQLSQAEKLYSQVVEMAPQFSEG